MHDPSHQGTKEKTSQVHPAKTSLFLLEERCEEAVHRPCVVVIFPLLCCWYHAKHPSAIQLPRCQTAPRLHSSFTLLVPRNPFVPGPAGLPSLAITAALVALPLRELSFLRKTRSSSAWLPFLELAKASAKQEQEMAVSWHPSHRTSAILHICLSRDGCITSAAWQSIGLPPSPIFCVLLAVRLVTQSLPPPPRGEIHIKVGGEG